MQKRQESRASKGRPRPGEGGGGLEPEDRETEDGLSDVSPLKQVSSDETPPPLVITAVLSYQLQNLWSDGLQMGRGGLLFPWISQRFASGKVLSIAGDMKLYQWNAV